ncbi:MAG: HD domain-containing protein [Victivallaceae bacterium]|nr:HD domain-containing protein [Victivallaceae bacterium]
MDFYRVKKHLIKRLETELSPQHYYHGSYHTIDVINAVEEIAANENIKGDDLVILKTAALFHDAGFLHQHACNETIACEISRATLGNFGYDNRQIEIICRIIMATALPHNPKNILEDIICDADLDYIGTDEATYVKHSERLRCELAEFGLSMDAREWLEMQIMFLESHKFFTKTNQQRREPVKQTILKHLKQKMKELN